MLEYEEEDESLLDNFFESIHNHNLQELARHPIKQEALNTDNTYIANQAISIMRERKRGIDVIDFPSLLTQAGIPFTQNDQVVMVRRPGKPKFNLYNSTGTWHEVDVRNPKKGNGIDSFLDYYESAKATGIDDIRHCPKCNAPMIKRARKADGEHFWGCVRFPNCTGTQPFEKEDEPRQHIPKEWQYFPTPESILKFMALLKKVDQDWLWEIWEHYCEMERCFEEKSNA